MEIPRHASSKALIGLIREGDWFKAARWDKESLIGKLGAAARSDL